MTRDVRKGTNESWFRDLNERLELRAAEASREQRFEVVCECAREECTERIELSFSEYEACGGAPRDFVVVWTRTRRSELRTDHRGRPAATRWCEEVPATQERSPRFRIRERAITRERHDDAERTGVDASLLEIGAVARELGVAPGTLRTWERRYRIVVPERGERGERLYDADQIMVLRRVRAEMRGGMRARAAHEHARTPRPLKTAHVRLDPAPEAPARARRAVEGLVEGGSDERSAFYLRLVASELVKNAVLYGSDREPIRMELKLFPDCVEMRVQNGGTRCGASRSAQVYQTATARAGRGLEIIDVLAEAWSIDTCPTGNEITVRPAPCRPPHEGDAALAQARFPGVARGVTGAGVGATGQCRGRAAAPGAPAFVAGASRRIVQG